MATAATTAKEESLLEAVASAEDPVDNDIESQVPPAAVEDTTKQEEGWIQVGSVATNLQTTQDDNTTTEDPTTSTILKDNPYKTLASTASSNAPTDNDKPTASTKTSNIGILSEEDDTASVFSFDSYEQRPSIPLRVQNIIQRSMNNNNDGSTNIPPNNNNSNTVPFPSVIGSTTYNDGDVVNVCPCRCLFFTLKETICLIMSALGCAVFLAGLVLLCMYLEGSIF